MTGQSATVELLTAQVRVLQVGSRQVTLSVYRQLDWVEPGEIEPFGRVADKPEPGTIEVVGSHYGVLARSAAHRTRWSCTTDKPHPLCPEGQRASKARHAAERADWDQVYSRRDGAPRPAVAVPPVPDHRHEWFTYPGSQELWERWERLPLIVLAGLR